jgi:hypothetical protein
MKKLGLVLFLLVLAAPLQALDQRIEQVIREGAIHPSLNSWIRSSRLGTSEVLLGRPVAYEGGMALYRFEKVETGEVDYGLVAQPLNPLGGRGGSPEVRRLLRSRTPAGPFQGGSASPKATSVRCDVFLYRDDSFRTLLLVTDLDWNALKEVGGLNDSISSLETTCTGWFFFEHTNWGGSVLFVPANTGELNLHTSFNFGDKISAIQQYLP